MTREDRIYAANEIRTSVLTSLHQLESGIIKKFSLEDTDVTRALAIASIEMACMCLASTEQLSPDQIRAISVKTGAFIEGEVEKAAEG